MPLVHFIAPTDPRWLSTFEAIGRELVSDTLVYRYDPMAAPDGLDGEEGTFSMCGFWYVGCLARAGYLEGAQLGFEKMLTYANYLGLHSEQIGASGELLGNFPQAFTHLAVISRRSFPVEYFDFSGRYADSEILDNRDLLEDLVVALLDLFSSLRADAR
jgi:GH15 family glucan-1,4-alpha-glucosidase